MPVPETARLNDGFDALLDKVTVALNAFAAFGENSMVRFVLFPGSSENGKLGVASAKYFVETEALLMTAAALPEFVKEMVSALVFPAFTLPKSRLWLASTRFPICCPPDPPELTPAQPAIAINAASANRIAAALKYFTESFVLEFFLMVCRGTFFPRTPDRVLGRMLSLPFIDCNQY